MNIKIFYLYRDASNYKNFNEIIFSNSDLIDLKYIAINLRKYFIDSQYFEAKAIFIPELYFENMNHDDHGWHEYIKSEITNEAVNDVKQRSIIDFINDIESWSMKLS